MNKLILITMMLVLSVAAVNAYVPAYITGYVTDANKEPLIGANVTVTCENGMPEYDVTDMNGEYAAIFLEDNQCHVTNQVYVVATYNGMSGSGNGTVCFNPERCPIPIAIVDITIPEMTLLGAMVVLLAGIGVIAYRRKQ
jgi:hypothetical protein